MTADINLQQLITSIDHRCRSQTALCCVPSVSFIISPNSDWNENLSPVCDFCTWQWDDSATFHTGAGQLQTSGGPHSSSRTRLRAAPMCTYFWKGWTEDWITYKAVIYKQYLTVKLRYMPEGRGLDSRWYHYYFSLTLSYRQHYGPGVDSASKRYEYQEYFLGGKVGRCVGLTILPPSCARLSWSLVASIFWNHHGLSMTVKGLLFL